MYKNVIVTLKRDGILRRRSNQTGNRLPSSCLCSLMNSSPSLVKLLAVETCTRRARTTAAATTLTYGSGILNEREATSYTPPICSTKATTTTGFTVLNPREYEVNNNTRCQETGKKEGGVPSQTNYNRDRLGCFGDDSHMEEGREH